MQTNLSESQIPPGGWQWFQPQTGWSAPFPVNYTLDDQAVNLIKHRVANPAITSKHKLATDFPTVKREIYEYNSKRLGIATVAGPKTMPPSYTPSAVGDVAGNVRKLAAGAALLMEWEESGLPPEGPGISDERAGICAVCPKNSSQPFTDFFTVPVAESIKKRLSRLHGMTLATTHDARLGTCTACLCPLKLKVHTPKDLILKRLTEKVRAELNQDKPRCWILAL